MQALFGKKLGILEIMAMGRTYEIMFDLWCDDLIHQMFQCFFSITRHHLDMVKTNMLSILSSVMGDRDVIWKKMQSELLSIWRKEQLTSPITYELAKRLVEQNIRLLKRQLTHEELWRICGDQPRNENALRRKGLSFICKEPWGPNLSCMSDTEEMTWVD